MMAKAISCPKKQCFFFAFAQYVYLANARFNTFSATWKCVYIILKGNANKKEGGLFRPLKT
jgi:hypothetical protein